MKDLRIAILGTGFISDLHCEIIKSNKKLRLVGCCDVNKLRAENFARRWGIENAYDEVTELLDRESLDVVHVLVPPDKHLPMCKTVISRGIDVFLEKPMALDSGECRDLLDAAVENNVKIGINHNFLFYPLFMRLKKDLASGIIGPPEYVVAYYGGPLGQLDSGKFGHWMFAQPGNILLEQGPHPVSQVMDILGETVSVQGKANGRRELGKDQYFYDRWEGLFTCEKGNAFINLAFGARFSPQRMVTVYGQDGAIITDFLSGRYLVQPKSVFPDYLDPTAKGLRFIPPAVAGIKDFMDYALAKVKIKSRSDAFFLTMKNSIEAFYDALGSNKPLPCSAEDGLKVIQSCEQWIEAADIPSNPDKKLPAPAPTSRDDSEVLVTGATGFIGKAMVEKLVSQGKKVRIFVRSARGLPASFYSPNVTVMTGDITDANAVFRAVEGIKHVVHLAFSLGNTWEEFEKLNIVPAENLARASLDNKVERFVFASTIAVFCYADLPRNGKRLAVVNSDSPVDKKPLTRNHYARCKIAIEERLSAMIPEGLPLMIARPGIVVGRDGILCHGGAGQWTRDNVCAFWGMGRNKLPFVLVDDVADALSAMLDREGLVGKNFNLVGDVRLTAREYIDNLKALSGRRITSFPYPTRLCFVSDVFKFGVKWVSGNRSGLLSYRDLANRSALADFDCRQEKELLGWSPCADREDFVQKGIGWAFSKDK